MSTYKNLMTVCAAVVLAFGLAACGSSDDDSAADDGAPAVTEPAGPTQADLDAAEAAAKKAQDALDKLAADALEAKNEGLFAAIEHEATDGTYTGDETEMTFALVKGAPTVKFGATAQDITATTKAAKLADSVTKTDKEMAAQSPFAEQFGEGPTVTLVDADHGDIAAASRFPNTGTVLYENNARTADATGTANNIVSLPGTLMGASGSYLCSTACSVSKTTTGVAFGTGWTFRPDTGAMVTVEDTDYTYYGWWALQRTDGTFRVGTFFDGTSASTNDEQMGRITSNTADEGGLPNSLTGKATFVGSAAGKYAIDNRPTGDVLDAGHFEAAATLTADFGSDGEAGTITGAITDFVTGETERDWSVALGKATFDATATPHFSTAGTLDTGEALNKWTIGGEEGEASGSWQGDFYHNNKPRNDDTPARVIGDFSVSHGTVAHMIGAFGAANSAADTPSK